MRNIDSIVTIRHDLEEKVYQFGVYATDCMVDKAGRQFRISRYFIEDGVHIGYFIDDNSDFIWTEDMFEPMKIRKEMSIDDCDRIIDNSNIFLSMIGDNV